MDGNFKAEHMKPKNSDQELWLMDGRGYMVTSDRYKQYLITTPNPVEVCESLEMWGGALLMAGPAVRLQQPPGSEPGKCTEKPVGSNRHWGMCMCKTWMFYSPCHGGLSKGGCACARHGCFIPHAMVDFQKGEQYVIWYQIYSKPYWHLDR